MQNHNYVSLMYVYISIYSTALKLFPAEYMFIHAYIAHIYVIGIIIYHKAKQYIHLAIQMHFLVRYRGILTIVGDQWNHYEPQSSGAIEEPQSSGTKDPWNQRPVEPQTSGTIEQWNHRVVKPQSSGTIEQYNHRKVAKWEGYNDLRIKSQMNTKELSERIELVLQCQTVRL